MQSVNAITCGTCVFWEMVRPDGKEGSCHRRSPVPVVLPNLGDAEWPSSYWPATCQEDWCGDGREAHGN